MSLKNNMKAIVRPIVKKVDKTWLCIPCKHLLDFAIEVRYRMLGQAKIEEEDRENVKKNLTFIYKSFNRQHMAKRLYRSIQAYYPGATIIIADDSAEPLDIPGAQIIHLPFNSGLSKGLIAALDKVETEYVMRMDDDYLLTPHSNIHKQLSFLQSHREVDLSSIQVSVPPEKCAEEYTQIKMKKNLIIPAGTMIDDHIVVYKAANCFVARTEKLRKVGYDPNIRMIDHHEFFYRAAGVLVSVLDPHSYVLHCHNRFDRDYLKYRMDTAGDSVYIRKKYMS